MTAPDEVWPGALRARSFPRAGFRNIVLIGARASGKSRAARRLAAATGWEHVSTDQRLEAAFGAIPEFVARHGWGRFREEETRVLAGISGTGLIVDCGGGIVERPENFGHLERLGTVYWIRAPLAYLQERLARPKHRKRRPPILPGALSPEAEAGQVLARRTPLYREAAEADIWSVGASGRRRPGEGADRLLTAHFGPGIAVIAGGATVGPEAAVERAFAAAGPLDAVELRWDLFPGVSADRLRALIGGLSPERREHLLVTVRRRDEGGAFTGDEDERAALLAAAAESGAGAVDLEGATDRQHAGALSRRIRSAAPGVRLVGSLHDFERCPDDLDAAAARLDPMDDGAGPQVQKLAVHASGRRDVERVIRWMRGARQRKQAVIGIALGAPGRPLRVVAGAFGAAVATYAPPGGEAAVAPGQLDADEVRSRHRRWGRRLEAPVPVYGVVGHPVAHSLSPPMHEAAFRSARLEAAYLKFDVPAAELADFLEAARLLGTAGLNVTVPHKSAVLPLLDRVDPDARRIGAVNTIAAVNGSLEGRNTDWIGVVRALEEELAAGGLRGRAVSVFGAGGSARAVLHGLLDRGARPRVTSRSNERAAALAAAFGVDFVPWEDRSDVAGDILVNATPVGMTGAGADAPLVPDRTIARHQLVFDLVYEPQRTPLLRRAAELGRRTVSGLSMLVFQAEAAFAAWTGVAGTAPVMAEAAATARAARRGASVAG